MLHQVYSVQTHLDVCSVPIQADDLCPLLKGSSRPSSATGKKAGVVTAVPRSKTVRHQRYDQGLGNVRAVPLHQVLGALAVGHSHHGHVRDLRDGVQACLHACLGEPGWSDATVVPRRVRQAHARHAGDHPAEWPRGAPSFRSR